MATTTTNVVAVDASTTVIGDNGTATIQAGTTATPNTNSATGTTVEGTATVTADTEQQVGALNSTFDIGNAGSLSVSEISTTTASGTSVAGVTTSTAEYSSYAGGILDTAPLTTTDVSIGNGGVLNATVDNTATATGISTAADATATADFTKGSYGLLDTGVSAGSKGDVTANLDANAVAVATTVGPVAGFADATATATFSDPIAAIYATKTGSGSIDIGDNGTVSGYAGLSADAINLSSTHVKRREGRGGQRCEGFVHGGELAEV